MVQSVILSLGIEAIETSQAIKIWYTLNLWTSKIPEKLDF